MFHVEHCVLLVVLNMSSLDRYIPTSKFSDVSRRFLLGFGRCNLIEIAAAS